MFEKEELQIILQTMTQISFKAGQSKEIVIVENIIKKIQNNFDIQIKPSNGKGKLKEAIKE
jgi:hypothetical protein